MKRKNILLVNLTVFFASVTADGRIGDKCKIATSNLPGICKLGTDCPIVQQEAKQGIDPTLCGFHEIIRPIVCCPDDPFTDDKQAEPLPQNLLIPDTSSKRLSEKKCEEYHPPITSVAVPQVYNGKPAKPKEFPHMAAIGYGEENDKKWACAGGLISENFVITAAHCISSRDLGKAKYIRVGANNILNVSLNDVDPQDFTIKRYIQYPEYRQPLKYHDIALIELNRPIKKTKYVNIACLDTERNHVSETLWIAGWGQTEFAGSDSGNLLKANVTVIDNQKCKSFYQDEDKLPNSILDDSMICAGGKSDTCNGDSGGPLMEINTKFDDTANLRVYNIIGITSFGRVCGIGGSPGIYTRIYNYLPWIENTVWPNES